MELNKGQREAVKKAVNFYKNGDYQLFEITGPAGSGKTTIIKQIVDILGFDLKAEVMFMALIGQATLVMRRKNLYAKTIHSALYDVVEVPKLDQYGREIINMDGRVESTLTFKKKPTIDPNVKLIVLDEASMVSEKLKKDILSFGIPIIALGDLYQLPPIIGKSCFFNNPDVRLTEVMRQAEGNPIIHISELARNKQDIPLGKYSNRCYVIDESELNNKLLGMVDAVICGKNVTRTNINNYVRRELLNFKSELPQKGDKLVCKKNNWNRSLDDIFLVNGLDVVLVNEIDKSRFNSEHFFMDVRPTFMEHNYFDNVKADTQFLLDSIHNQKKEKYYGKLDRFEYGYAKTCHSAQGSQYDTGIVIEEFLNKEYHSNWLYTAITRMVDFMILVKKERKIYY